MSEHSLVYSFRISADAASALEKLPACIDEANPVPERKRASLRYNIRDLWRSLTMERALRNIDYLNNPAFFSAYLRYFLPWNLVRLIALLTELPLELKNGSIIVDMGSGPLTFPLALYCAKPELRKVPLTIIGADRAPRIMEAGKLILELLAAKHGGELPPWNIELRHLRFGEPIREKADLFCAVNVLNEFFWHHEGILADDAAEILSKIEHYCTASGRMLIVEPGEPRSGGLLSAIRASAILSGEEVEAPCPHANACPMPGIFKSGQEYLTGRASPLAHKETKNEEQKKRSIKDDRMLEPVQMPSPRTKYPWCHFSVPAEFAPRWLRKLSFESGLAKEKLSFSFLYIRKTEGNASRSRVEKGRESLCRIVSDPILLPGDRQGKYACSAVGYTLVTAANGMELPASGSLVPIHKEIKERGSAPNIDRKSGAIIVSY